MAFFAAIGQLAQDLRVFASEFIQEIEGAFVYVAARRRVIQLAEELVGQQQYERLFEHLDEVPEDVYEIIAAWK